MPEHGDGLVEGTRIWFPISGTLAVRALCFAVALLGSVVIAAMLFWTWLDQGREVPGFRDIVLLAGLATGLMLIPHLKRYRDQYLGCVKSHSSPGVPIGPHHGVVVFEVACMAAIFCIPFHALKGFMACLVMMGFGICGAAYGAVPQQPPE